MQKSAVQSLISLGVIGAAGFIVYRNWADVKKVFAANGLTAAKPVTGSTTGSSSLSGNLPGTYTGSGFTPAAGSDVSPLNQALFTNAMNNLQWPTLGSSWRLPVTKISDPAGYTVARQSDKDPNTGLVIDHAYTGRNILGLM